MGSSEATVVGIVVVVYFVIVLWPVTLICRRTGHSPWLAILAIIPVANVALLWFIALSRWPSTQAQGTAMPQWSSPAGSTPGRKIGPLHRFRCQLEEPDR